MVMGSVHLFWAVDLIICGCQTHTNWDSIHVGTLRREAYDVTPVPIGVSQTADDSVKKNNICLSVVDPFAVSCVSAYDGQTDSVKKNKICLSFGDPSFVRWLGMAHDDQTDSVKMNRIRLPGTRQPVRSTN
jgi:hypothetical protein